MAAHRLLAWPTGATSEARNIALRLIRSHDAPISTRELFEKAVKVPAQTRSNSEPLTPSARHLSNSKPAPPHPDHPIRSMSYLKRVVLEDLVRTQDIKKVHIKRVLSPEEIEQRKATMAKAQLKKTSTAALSHPVSTWMWRVAEKSRASSLTLIKKDEEVVGAEVGVGEDWSHLNKRRRRAREENVKREVRWMGKVDKARASTV